MDGGFGEIDAKILTVHIHQETDRKYIIPVWAPPAARHVGIDAPPAKQASPKILSPIFTDAASALLASLRASI